MPHAWTKALHFGSTSEKAVVRRRSLILWGLCLAAALAGACGQKETAVLPTGRASAANDQFNLRRYELKIGTVDLARLEGGEFSNETRPATFTAGGKVYPVKVRIRGSWSRSWPKKSLKLFFDKGNTLEGHHSINLNSGWRDPAFVREPLAYYVYSACGAPAPSARLVRLEINGAFAGLYVQVEQPDKEFLNRVGLPSASLYKAVSRSNDADERDVGAEEAFRACYNKETHKGEGYTELKEFCHALRTTETPADFFHNQVDLDRYINYLSATVLIQNWDSFNKNHFLAYDGASSHKWLVVPWDLDRTFGDHWNGMFDEARLPLLLGTRDQPGVTGWNRLEDRFFSEPALRSQFLKRLTELLKTEFTEQQLYPVLDRMEAEIAEDAPKDRRKWPGTGEDLRTGIRQVKSFIKNRRDFLLNEISRLEHNQVNNASR